MNAMNLEDRWVYKGSYTEPPCTGGVYWNVVRTVYPIDNNMLEYIKNKMMKLSAEHEPGLYTYDPSIFLKETSKDNSNFIATPRLKMYR